MTQACRDLVREPCRSCDAPIPQHLPIPFGLVVLAPPFEHVGVGRQERQRFEALAGGGVVGWGTPVLPLCVVVAGKPAGITLQLGVPEDGKLHIFGVLMECQDRRRVHEATAVSV